MGHERDFFVLGLITEPYIRAGRDDHREAIVAYHAPVYENVNVNHISVIEQRSAPMVQLMTKCLIMPDAINHDDSAVGAPFNIAHGSLREYYVQLPSTNESLWRVAKHIREETKTYTTVIPHVMDNFDEYRVGLSMFLPDLRTYNGRVQRTDLFAGAQYVAATDVLAKVKKGILPGNTWGNYIKFFPLTAHEAKQIYTSCVTAVESRSSRAVDRVESLLEKHANRCARKR